MTSEESPSQEKHQRRLDRERRQNEAIRRTAAALTAVHQAAGKELAEQVSAIKECPQQREAAGIVRWIPLAAILTSRHQTRVVISGDDAELESLAASIEEHGLMSFPIVRPAADRPGHFELVAGHRRVAALRLIDARGAAASAIRDCLRPAAGGSVIPVISRSPEDLAAFAQTIAENDHRSDLKAWERAHAYRGFQLALEEAGLKADLDSLAHALGLKAATIAPYVRVAQRITPDVVQCAGLSSEAAARLLLGLPLGNLRLIAGPKSVTQRAELLRAQLDRAPMDGATEDAAEEPAPPPRHLRRRKSSSAGFQMNIRVPLAELRSSQAVRYVTQMTPALRELIVLALPDLDQREAERLTGDLDAAIIALKSAR